MICGFHTVIRQWQTTENVNIDKEAEIVTAGGILK